MTFKELKTVIFWDAKVEIRCGKMTHQGLKEKTFSGKWIFEYDKHPEMWDLEILCINPKNGGLCIHVKEE